MKVYKFGGASVKDAEGVRNVGHVLSEAGFDNCVLVVSAMGKTTNALEEVVGKYFKKENYTEVIKNIENRHLSVAEGLFAAVDKIFAEISMFFKEIESFLRMNQSGNYDLVYDQVVSRGELVSSKILSAYLHQNSFPNTWLDARNFIKTDGNYREGNVDWETTERHIKSLPQAGSFVTQGFIGGYENQTVTLGREGSDYSAAIFAYALEADEMAIWKDVPGVMTGDPQKFKNTKLICNLSYEETIEMAYYGASVIHPKTLQPLKQKKIPFFVKSFRDPRAAGTRVGEHEGTDKLPVYIIKENQIFLKIATKNFSFMAEEHLSFIFHNLAKFKIKISLMQNTAISLQLCLDDKYRHINAFAEILEQEYRVDALQDVSLFTIRNAADHRAEEIFGNREILLEQSSGHTHQIVTR